MKHGYGVYTFANRDKYEGEFFNNNMHGQGVLMYANGDSLVGRWKNDQINGRYVSAKKCFLGFAWRNAAFFDPISLWSPLHRYQALSGSE